MNMKNISIAAIAALILTACGESSGPSNPATADTGTPDSAIGQIQQGLVEVQFRIMTEEDISDLTAEVTGNYGWADSWTVTLTDLSETVQLPPGDFYAVTVMGPDVIENVTEFSIPESGGKIVGVEVPITFQREDPQTEELNGTEDCDTVLEHPDWAWLHDAVGVHYQCGDNPDARCFLEQTDDPEGCGIKCQPLFYYGFMALEHIQGLNFRYTDEYGTVECAPASSRQ